MKKILFVLNNAFTNDSRVLKEATSNTNMGYEVTLVCKWQAGLSRDEVKNNFRIKRVGFNIFASIPILKRLNVLVLWIYAFLESFKDYQVIHCHDWDTLPVGVLGKICSFGKKKLVYDSHEYATERWVGNKLNKFIVKAVELSCIKFADKVITVSNSIAEEYKRIYKIPKPELILNCPQFSAPKIYDLFRDKFGISKDATIFLYQGGINQSRNIDLILSVFKKINDPMKVVVFIGCGDMVEDVISASKITNNILYYPAVSPDELVKFTSSADIGLIVLKNYCLNHEYCLPNKLFEYAMSGLPVITTDLFEIKRINESYKIGYLLEGDFETKLYNLVKKLDKSKVKKISENSLEFAKIYNWEEQEKVLKTVYDF